MLRPYIMLTDARAPHPDWRRARVPAVAVARVVVPRSARVSGAADAAYAALADRPDVDPQRIYVYGRSLGSAVATYTAAHHPVAGLILESPFTNAAAMAKYHYGLLPRFLLRLSLDNVANVRRVSCPILLFHGDADRLVPTAMGMAVAAAATGP